MKKTGFPPIVLFTILYYFVFVCLYHTLYSDHISVILKRQQEHRFADRQRPYKRKDGRDYRPRMEERPNWSRRDEQHTRDRDPGLFVRGRWSVVYNRYVNCNVWRSHMPTNYRDRRHARVMNRSEEHFMRRGHDRDLRQTHHGRGGYTHAGGYRERCQHSYRHPYQR